MVIVTGRLAAPACAAAVIVPLAPTFAVATANAPVPVVPGIFTIPSLLAVATSAMTSGTGVVDADNSNVFSPLLLAAALAFVHVKLKAMSVGMNAADGVNASTKLCAAPG
jgi:hypothetical protein